jgi:hypothetical protein
MRCRLAVVNGNALLASVLVGSIGLGLFVYGKKQRRVPHLVMGIALMVYPYFVPSVAVMLVIAGALLGLLILISYLGI